MPQTEQVDERTVATVVRAARRPRGAVAALVAVATLAATGGCGSLHPDGSAAAAVAGRFHDLVRRGDGRAACALLVRSTVQELEQSSGRGCPAAVLGAGLPRAMAVRGNDAYGRSARVLMDHDVVFLTVVGHLWRVRAAGCTADGQRPYDCKVKGG
jgi:hypothetical protein